MDQMRAKEILFREQCTCVLVKGERILRSHERGVKPLLQWLSGEEPLEGFSAADKVVGKATAFLYVRLGVCRVYANVMSRGAVEVLTRWGVEYSCGEQVQFIFNRKKDGLCPMESAVRHIDDPDAAICAIRERYQNMNSR